MAKAKIKNLYGLGAEFETALACWAAHSKNFWPLVGAWLDPEAIQAESPRLVLRAAKACAPSVNGAAPPDLHPVKILHTLDQWVREGRVDAEQAQAVRTMFSDFHDNPSPLDAMTVLADTIKTIRDRALHAAVNDTIGLFAKGKTDVGAVVEKLQAVDSIGRGDQVDRARAVDEAMLPRVAEAARRPKQPIGIPELDGVLGGGARSGALNIVVGGTGSGKSQFLGHAFVEALTTHRGSLFASLELGETSLFARIAANLCTLPAEEIEAGSETVLAETSRRLRLLRGEGMLGFGLFQYFSPGSTTVAQLDAWVQATQDEHGEQVGFLAVDYIGLLGGSGKVARHEELALIVRQLRGLAMKRDIVVWTAAQLSGEGGTKKNKEIEATQVAGSREIPNTCDLLIGITRDADDMAMIKVVKNRHGRGGHDIGPLPTDFDYGRFAVVERKGWPKW